VDACISDPTYGKNLESIRLISKRYRGVEKCAEVIRSYS